METGEVSDEETFASQFGLGKKKTKDYPFRQCLFEHWFKILLIVLVLGVIIGLVLVDIRTNRSLDSTEMKVSELKRVIKGDEKSINSLITNIDILTIKSQIVVIKNELKEVKDENAALSANISNLAEEPDMRYYADAADAVCVKSIGCA
jgi:septal ring factor EnvC (AmiA/AmiB activator)